MFQIERSTFHGYGLDAHSCGVLCDVSTGGGVLDADCGGRIDHSVLAVGYDTGAKTPYYIVKNSPVGFLQSIVSDRTQHIS